jgi:hypothetical protein
MYWGIDFSQYEDGRWRAIVMVGSRRVFTSPLYRRWEDCRAGALAVLALEFQALDQSLGVAA